MMTFRKLAAASSGKLIRAYFTENRLETAAAPDPLDAPDLDRGGRLTGYYTGRDRRATWRPDMARSIANAIGIDPTRPPKDAELDRLFEAKRADTGEPWTQRARKLSAYDLTIAPHKSVTLAAEFALSPAETAMIRHAIDRSGDATMRYVARELGWARKGAGGEDGAEPGAVAWAAFRHHNARPTLPVEDGQTGITYLADVPIPGDPHDHIHYALFNVVATASGHVGSLDTQRLQNRVHEFGAYFQALLADELRQLGIAVASDKNEQAAVVTAIPQIAVDLFSKGRRQTLRHAKAYAKRQGLDWETLDAERKFGILAVSGLAARSVKFGSKDDREVWRDQAAEIGWTHMSVLDDVAAPRLSDAEWDEQAYQFVARHLAKEFRTAAVVDHDVLRTFAARSLIGVGVRHGVSDIERVVQLVERRGLVIEGEHAAILQGLAGDTLRITNSAQVRIENALESKAQRTANDRSGALSAEALTAAIAASGIDFEHIDPEHGRAQRAAIYALGMGSALNVLTGPGGAGKTTLLRPLVAAYQADTRYYETGRDVIGLSTGWMQTDALDGAGIKQRVAVDPFLRGAEAGEIKLSKNTVLIIDEISQVGPRSFLKLLELQEEHGFVIKALGDPEQCQAIEAGNTIELLRRVLPASARPQIFTTIRQATQRGREIASLFRDGRAKEALAMKREDGTARLIGGDQDQVIERIADLYMHRRDALLAAGVKHGVTISALTNADAADISRVVRERLKARGEIGGTERMVAAIDQNGETYDMPLAIGDKVRLYRKTSARIDGKFGFIGSNGDVVELVAWSNDGMILRHKDGREGRVDPFRLLDARTGRMLLGFGHAVTIDSSQGRTTGEHINAMPRGTAGATGFKTYTAESRHVWQAYTMISEAAVFEAVKHRRALGDTPPVTTEQLWDHVGEDMGRKEYKPLGVDLLDPGRKQRAEERLQEEKDAVQAFLDFKHETHGLAGQGRRPGSEIRERLREEAVARALATRIEAIDGALARNAGAINRLGQNVGGFLTELRAQTAEIARRGVKAARERQARQEAAPQPGLSPSPY